jgi:outer membrane protein assembly factor BamB
MGRRNTVRSLAAAVLCIGAAGCWPSEGANPERTAHNAAESVITAASVGSLAEEWTATTDGGAGVTAGPIVSSAGVHVATDEGLYGVARATGDRLWRGQPAGSGQRFDGPISIVDGGLVATSGVWSINEWGDRRTYDPATGTASGPTPSGFVDGHRGTTLLTRDETCYVFTGCITALTVVDLDDPAAHTSGVLGPSTYAPLTLGSLAVYQTGQGVPLVQEPQLHGTMAVRAFPLAGIGGGCGVPGMDLACPTWFTPVDGHTAPSVVIGPGEQMVYTATSAGTVYALDAGSGAVLWTGAAGAAVAETPALADGSLYVPTADGDLVVFDAAGCGAATCAPLWQAATGAAISAQPAVAGGTGGVVFTTGTDGSIDAFATAGCGAPSCDPLWSTETGSEITGAPAVSGGHLYVGTADGRLISFAPGG